MTGLAFYLIGPFFNVFLKSCRHVAGVKLAVAFRIFMEYVILVYILEVVIEVFEYRAR